MAHEALYRKYRPQTFQELAGQDPVARTLCNAITLGRLSHAYLFTGPRGTGKTTTARLLAKSLNCATGPTSEPCGPPGAGGECADCEAIRLGKHLDVVEIDAASNRGIDDIRSLQERVRLAPIRGRWKVFIIDEVHMLTDPAWNALLKTLEEPPPSCVFVLATTEVHKVLATVVSRCQRFDFQRIATPVLCQRLAEVAMAEGLVVEPAALEVVARRADGGLRDALSLLDQVASSVDAAGPGADRIVITAQAVFEALGMISDETVLQLGSAIADQDAVSTLESCGRLLAQGHDHRTIIRELLNWAKNLLLLRVAKGRAQALGIPPVLAERLTDQAQRFTHQELIGALEALRETDELLRNSPQAAIWLEVGMLRLCLRIEIGSALELSSRVRALEERLSMNTGATPAQQPPPKGRPATASIASSLISNSPAPFTQPATPPGAEPLRPTEAKAPRIPASVSSAEGAPAAQAAAAPHHSDEKLIEHGSQFQVSNVERPAPLAQDHPPSAAAPGGAPEDVLAAVKNATRSLRVSLRSNFDQFAVGASRRPDGTVVLKMKQDALFKDGTAGFKALWEQIRQIFGPQAKLEVQLASKAAVPAIPPGPSLNVAAGPGVVAATPRPSVFETPTTSAPDLSPGGNEDCSPDQSNLLPEGYGGPAGVGRQGPAGGWTSPDSAVSSLSEGQPPSEDPVELARDLLLGRILEGPK